MKQEEFEAKMKELSEGVRFMDLIIHRENPLDPESPVYLTDKQIELFDGLLDMFKRLRWQIPFNNYKELRVDENSKVISVGRGCGIPVRVRPCAEEYGDKTFFGFMLGDIANSISHSIDPEGNVTARHSYHNPAIFVPALGKIIFGYESWWGKIESEEELQKAISDDDISNVWYVKALAKSLGVESGEEAEECSETTSEASGDSSQ